MKRMRARRQMVVGGCEGDRGVGKGTFRINVGNTWGKTGIFCWGLHAENVPRLSPTLKKLA